MRSLLCLVTLCFAPSFLAAQTPEEVKATIKFVQARQQADGGFTVSAAEKEGQTSLRATSGAIRALKYFGGEVPDREKAAKFVAACFDTKTGGYSDKPQGKPEIILTAVGIMAAVELKMPDAFIAKAVDYLAANTNPKEFEEMRIAAAGFDSAKKFPMEVTQRWLAEVVAKKNNDGSYLTPTGDARMTGSAVALILRLGGTLTDAERKASLAILKGGQRTDGGFGKADSGSDLETTYRVIRAFHMLKEKPGDVAKLTVYIGKCRNPDGGYGVEPGKPSTIAATYYASILLHWQK